MKVTVSSIRITASHRLPNPLEPLNPHHHESALQLLNRSKVCTWLLCGLGTLKQCFPGIFPIFCPSKRKQSLLTTRKQPFQFQAGETLASGVFPLISANCVVSGQKHCNPSGKCGFSPISLENLGFFQPTSP